MGVLRCGGAAPAADRTSVSSFLGPLLGRISRHTAPVTSTFDRIKKALFVDSRIPVIPAQETPKPTIVFDFKDFLVCNRFSLRRFDLLPYRRAFCEEFLYNLVGHYELISVADTYPPEGSFLMPRIDPFGCITYRLYVQDKRAFTPAHLNRPLRRVVVLSTKQNEFSPAFADNTIHLPRWQGKNESALLDLVHFFNNLRFLNLSEYRPTIKSYGGRDFISFFRIVQEWLYNQRNMFSTTRFSTKLADVNRRRISEYETARQGMETIRKSERPADYSSALYFVKNVIL